MDLSYQALKARQREIRDGFPESLGLRTHRALSWLNRAEQAEDADGTFIFLWIAFNAAYANELPDNATFSERRLFLTFLRKLIALDTENLIYKLVWENFSTSIRLLINNQYVFQPFWDFHNGKLTEAEWVEMFENHKRMASRALGRMNTEKVLVVAFDRLYTLRNQLVHGGATWNSGVNRSQVNDGVRILGLLVPIVIHLMMENPRTLWGDASYPVV
ncbi:MAG: hypothetical protein V2I25_15450 [Woeseiaceae bacterium]|nr:hypothetical protein [Woeseiaceae bacterium]